MAKYRAPCSPPSAAARGSRFLPSVRRGCRRVITRRTSCRCPSDCTARAPRRVARCTCRIARGGSSTVSPSACGARTSPSIVSAITPTASGSRATRSRCPTLPSIGARSDSRTVAGAFPSDSRRSARSAVATSDARTCRSTSNRMNFTMAHAEVMYFLPRLSGLRLDLGAAHTLSGRNVGQSTTIMTGFTYALHL